MKTVFIGLGSNKANRLAYLQMAVEALGEVMSNITLSSIYESAALLPEGAPKEWDVSFYNMVLKGDVQVSSAELLEHLQALENKIGRTRQGHWSPREIDLDILAFGDEIIQTEALTIPHAEMLKRDFVLLPMAQIAPEWCYPVEGTLYFNQSLSSIIEAENMAENAGLQRKAELTLRATS